MRHLVPGDDHTDSNAIEGLVLGATDPVRDLEEMGEQIPGRVDPMIDFLDRHDERVPARKRIDRHERHTLIIAMHKGGRNLSGDDAAEDRGHVTNVRSAEWKRKRWHRIAT